MKKIPYPDEVLDTPEKKREHIGRLVVHAKNILQIDGYMGTVVLPGENNFEDGSKDDTLMSIDCGYPYREYKIFVQKKTLDEMEKEPLDGQYWEKLEQVVFHELVHLIIAPLSDAANRRYVSAKELEQNEENVVDHLSIAFHMQIYRSRSY